MFSHPPTPQHHPQNKKHCDHTFRHSLHTLSGGGRGESRGNGGGKPPPLGVMRFARKEESEKEQMKLGKYKDWKKNGVFYTLSSQRVSGSAHEASKIETPYKIRS